jgi:hypothetical protein
MQPFGFAKHFSGFFSKALQDQGISFFIIIAKGLARACMYISPSVSRA